MPSLSLQKVQVFAHIEKARKTPKANILMSVQSPLSALCAYFSAQFSAHVSAPFSAQFPTDRTAQTTAFYGPVVDHWLEWKIAQTTNVSAMQEDPNLYS